MAQTRAIELSGAKARWRALNSRRIGLILLDTERGLTAEEQAELSRLQEEASRYINAVTPLPFDELAEIEKAARQLSGPAH